MRLARLAAHVSIVGLLGAGALLACRSAPAHELIGEDYSGWLPPSGAAAAHWRVRDGILVCESPAGILWTESPFGDCELRAEVRATFGRPTAVFHARGPGGFEIGIALPPDGGWSQVRMRMHGENVDVEVDGEESRGTRPRVARSGAIGVSGEGTGRIEFRNLVVREH